MRKAIKNIPFRPAALALVLVTVSSWLLSGCAPFDPSSATALSRAADHMNKSLPERITPEMELMRVTGAEKKITYHYRFIHQMRSDSLAEKLRTMKPIGVKPACSTPQILDVFLRHGTTIEMKYYDKDTVYFAAIDITLADCADTGQADGAKTGKPL